MPKRFMLERLPSILFWTAFSAVLIVLGAIGYAVVSLGSRPGGNGAEWEAKLLVGLLVLAAAFVAGLLARGLGHLVGRLLRAR